MIRESIEKGTMVFHGVYGHGLFVKFFGGNKHKAIVYFSMDNRNILVFSKDLNEVER